MIRVRSEKEQHARRKLVIDCRLDSLLPRLMDEAGIDMWLITGGGFEEDALFDLFLADRPLKEVMLAVCREPEGLGFYGDTAEGGSLGGRFRGVKKPGETGSEAIARLIKEKAPRNIGVNRSSEYGFIDTMSLNCFEKLVSALGEAWKERFVSAEKLAIRYLETRVPAEMEHYEEICAIAREIYYEVMTRENIIPGVTTTADLEWTLRQAMRDRGVGYTWGPDVDLQRRGLDEMRYGLGCEGCVIEDGDLLHVDFGIRYMGLESDMQYLTYMLREGETEAPAGIKKAFDTVLALQDIYLSTVRPGVKGNIIWHEILKKAEAAGINAMVYSHSLGTCCHGAGACIGHYGATEDVIPLGEYLIGENCCYVMELNAKVPVADWDGQEIYVFTEDDVFVSEKGTAVIGHRQERLWEI